MVHGLVTRRRFGRIFESVREGLQETDVLRELRARLKACSLLLEVPGVGIAREARDETAAQIADYLLPRLERLDAPLLVVVGGSTGAGKSTLVNSLVGAEVSPAGVLRPTTRAPVLACHPQDKSWFQDDRILPSFARTTGGAPSGSHSLHLVLDSDVPRGISLLDAPDIDSVEVANRILADQLLAAGDLWLFVTTAARYADAVPWELLSKAQARAIALAVVLNRIPSEALAEVPSHLRALLDAAGLERAPVLSVPESELEVGLLPKFALEPVRAWLDELARDQEQRERMVRMTLAGALDSLAARTALVARGLDAQSEAVKELNGAVARSYERALEDVSDALSGGTLLRGEVLARWQEVVGTGDFMKSLEARIGRLRDRVAEAVLGRPSPAGEVQSALSESVGSVVRAAADRAAESVVDRWREHPAGRHLLTDEDRALSRSSAELPSRIADELRAWQEGVLQLVSSEGASKRAAGRALSLGVNGVGAALMVVVFAHTGGLTGGELAVAGGTATVSQKLLEALFGDQAVRTLTARARDDLIDRIAQLMWEHEAARFYGLLKKAIPPKPQADELRATVAALADARS